MDTTDLERHDSKKVEIFCCYARRDQSLLLDLKAHLTPLEREELITLWADIDINAGADWEDEIHHHLNRAHIILLLVSPDFMASDYCYSVEMRQAMERHKRGEAQVIPIIARPIDWQNAPFGKLQSLPKNAIPIVSSVWHTQDDAFLSIAEGIRVAVEGHLAKEEKRRKAKQIEQTARREGKKLPKVAEEEKDHQLLDLEESSRPANRASTISKIEPVRLLFCICTMSIGIFSGISLANIYNLNDINIDYLSVHTSSEAAGAFIVITIVLGGLAFLIPSKRARVNILKGSVLIFIGNALLISSLSYNHVSDLPLWLICTTSVPVICTSINYFMPGIISIILCMCIILLGGYFFWQQAKATIGAIVGSLMIITSIGFIALLSPELIMFRVQQTAAHLPTPLDLGIPLCIIEIMLGIAILFITRRNEARV